MRNSIIHGNRTLTRYNGATSSSFNHQQHASLSVVAGAAAVVPLTSSSSSSQQHQHQQQHRQQQDRWYRRKSAAAATIAGNHPKRGGAGGASGGSSGHGSGRRNPITTNDSRSRDKKNHASSSSSPLVPFAYRAQQHQQQQRQDSKHNHHDDNRRHQQQQQQSYQDNFRYARHQPNFHRNASRFPSSSSSSSPPFTGSSSRLGLGTKAAAAAAAKSQEQKQIKQHKAMIQQTEKELVKLVQQDLVQLANQYRSILNSNTLSDSDNEDDDDDDDDNHNKTLNPKHGYNAPLLFSFISSNGSYDDTSSRCLVKSLIETITETLDDMHQTGNMMEWSQIQETENVFRQVCTLLQETVRKSCHVHPIVVATSVSRLASSSSSSSSSTSNAAANLRLNRNNNNNRAMKTTKAAAPAAHHDSADSSSMDQEEDNDDDELDKDWMDLAACCLHQLDILITERTLMVEATRKWKSETPSKQLLEKSDVDSSSSSSFKGWASSLFPSFRNNDKETAKATTSTLLRGVALLFGSQNSHQGTKGNQEEQQQQQQQQEQQPRKEYVCMAHEDISLGPTQGLFRLAIESIASTIPQQQQQQSHPKLSPSSPLDESSELSSVVDPGVIAAANEKYRQALQPIANRLVQLFDLVPTDSTPDLTNVQTVLEITTRVGTLESARQCSRLFNIATSSSLPLSPPFHGSSSEHADLIPFTLVLRAYLEAAKYEKDKHNRIIVAQEAAKLLGARWDQQLPRHKVTRIAEATLVLHCIAIVMARACSSSSSLNAETISFFCSDADNLFRRAANHVVYHKFYNAILAKDESSPPSFTPNGSALTTSLAAIDYRILRILPLANYLVRILALSGKADGDSNEDDSDGFLRLEQAKRIICKMVSEYDRVNSSNFSNKTIHHSAEDEASSSTRRYMTLNFDVETVNAVIQGMVHRHREQLQHQQDKKLLLLHNNLVQNDLEVATKLLDFTMSRREVRIWPNDETFGGMSALLTVLKPSDVGERLENLLDQMETRRYFSHRLMPITISLSVYNRVLWGLWQEAQLYKTEPRGTSKRAQALLERLEMRSTPLWMTDDMVRKLHYSIAPLSSNLLYDLGLKPTKRTYELVLNVCASTAAPSEFEMAASVAAKVVERMRQLGMTDGNLLVSSTLRTCAGRLPQDSDTRQYVESLLMLVERNNREEEEVSDPEERVASHVG